jgi:hypothetical protein
MKSITTMKLHFKAPWGRSLKGMSIFITLICIGVSISGFFAAQLRDHGLDFWIHAMTPILILLVSLPFVIRGYTITEEALLIHRLLWDTRLPLADIRSAEAQSEAMAKSLRTFGNGGLYSFTGWYRNKALGNYRAFVTDLKRTVVLHCKTRCIVISPDDPEDFVEAMKAHLPATPP